MVIIYNSLNEIKDKRVKFILKSALRNSRSFDKKYDKESKALIKRYKK